MKVPLEYLPETFKVIRPVRPKFTSTGCDRVVEAAASPKTWSPPIIFIELQIPDIQTLLAESPQDPVNRKPLSCSCRIAVGVPR